MLISHCKSSLVEGLRAHGRARADIRRTLLLFLEIARLPTLVKPGLQRRIEAPSVQIACLKTTAPTAANTRVALYMTSNPLRTAS